MQLFVQVAEFKFESKIELLPVICNNYLRFFQETIEGFDCNINGGALGAALLHSFGRGKSMAELLGQRSGPAWADWTVIWNWDGRAQTQDNEGISELVAVAVGSYLFTCGDSATTLVVLT